MLKTFKAQDEYVWKEYIKFLNLLVAIQKSRQQLIEVEQVPIRNFIDQEQDFNKVFSELYIEIYEAMIKRMQSIMTLGWHNDR